MLILLILAALARAWKAWIRKPDYIDV